MLALPSSVLVLSAILLFPRVLAGSRVLDAMATEREEGPAH
jgi:hypothetical protein